MPKGEVNRRQRQALVIGNSEALPNRIAMLTAGKYCLFLIMLVLKLSS